MGDPSKDDVKNALKAVGVPDDKAEEAATEYAVIDANASDGVKAFAAGAMSLNVSSPISTVQGMGAIIAAGLLVTGVGAPAAAVVAAGVQIVTTILGVLGIGTAPPQPKCAWRAIMSDEQVYYQQRNISDEPYQGLCVGPSHELPWGPGDPGWENIQNVSPDDLQRIAPSGWRFGTWPHIPSSDQMQEQFNPAYDHRLDDFLQAFRIVWLANAERALNGHRTAGQYGLLKTFAHYWSDLHEGPTLTLQQSPSSDPNDPKRDRRGGPINDMLNGVIDGQRNPPLAINVGPRARTVKLHPIPKQMNHTSKAGVIGVKNAMAGTVETAALTVGLATVGAFVAGPLGIVGGGLLGLAIGSVRASTFQPSKPAGHVVHLTHPGR